MITLARPAKERPRRIITFTDSAADRAGVVGTVLGHGVTAHSGYTDPSTVLLMAQETITTDAVCEKALHDVSVDFCAGGNGISGACEGDSGGPFMTHDSAGQFVLTGIVSLGSPNGCAVKGDYDEFTKIRGTQVGRWLDTQVGSHAGSASSSPAPRISNLTQSQGTWREGSKLATSSRAQAPIGTTFSYALNQRARVSLAFTQLVSGRLDVGTCVPFNQRDRGDRRCPFDSTKGTLAFTGHPGTNKIVFQGRLSRSHALKPGRYRLYVTAIEGPWTPNAGEATDVHDRG